MTTAVSATERLLNSIGALVPHLQAATAATDRGGGSMRTRRRDQQQQRRKAWKSDQTLRAHLQRLRRRRRDRPVRPRAAPQGS